MSTPRLFSPPTILPEQLFSTPLVDPDSGIVMSWSWKQFFQKFMVPAKIQTLTANTHATRGNLAGSSVVPGSIFYETDRTLYYVAQGGAWRYLAGVFQVPQTGLPTDLGPNDAGVLVNVTDFSHWLEWNGTGWQWGPGDSQSGFSVPFVVDPPDNGWQACDGSSGIPQLASDGTLNFVTVPNVAGSFFRQ
jgi:hypothetical protein